MKALVEVPLHLLALPVFLLSVPINLLLNCFRSGNGQQENWREREGRQREREKTLLSLLGLQMSSLFELREITLHMSLFNVIKRCLKETHRALDRRLKMAINEKKSEFKIDEKTLSKTKCLQGEFKQINRVAPAEPVVPDSHVLALLSAEPCSNHPPPPPHWAGLADSGPPGWVTSLCRPLTTARTHLVLAAVPVSRCWRTPAGSGSACSGAALSQSSSWNARQLWNLTSCFWQR